MFQFAQGVSYAAGFDDPAAVSNSTLVEAVEDEGFSVLWFDGCQGLTFPIQGAGECGDEWDAVAVVKRTGPTASLEVPDRVKWISALSGPPDVGTPDVVDELPTVNILQCAEASARMCDRKLKASRLWWGAGLGLAGVAAGALAMHFRMR